MGVSLDEFLAADSGDELRRKAQANMSLRFGVESNPDQAAQQLDLAKRYNLPVDVVKLSPDEFAARAKAEDAQAIIRQSPKLEAWLAQNRTNAEIAHDNVPQLGAMEGITRQLSGSVRALAAGLATDFNQAAWASAETGARIIGADTLAGFFGSLRKGQEQLGKDIQGDYGSQGTVEAGIASGFRSFGATVPGTVASLLTGNPQFMLGMGSLQAGGQAMGKANDKGLNPWQSLAYGLEDATAEYATELLPVGRLFKDLKAGAPFWKLLGTQFAMEVPTELAATAWQNANEWMNLNPEKSFNDYLGGLPEAEAQTVIATLVQTALTAGIGHGATRIAQRLDKKAADARQATDAYAALQQLGQLAAAGPLRERSPEAFNSAMQMMTEDGQLQDVYIDGRTLVEVFNQAGITQDELQQKLPAVAGQLLEALETNSDVRISTADYLTQIAGGPVEAGLLPNLKIDPAGQTYAEAQQFYQSQAEQLQAQAEQLVQQRVDDIAFQAERQAVHEQITQQLGQANRFTGDVNAGYATLARDFYVTMAERLGVKPTELLAKYPLRVAAEGVTGEQFNQAARVDQQIDQWAEGKLAGGEIIDFGRPYEILRSFGLEDLPIHLTTSVLRKSVEKHRVAPTELRGIARAIQQPLAVFASKKGPNHRVVLTELQHADGNIIVALELNKTRRDIEINDIRSMHPKDTDNLLRWIEDGLLLGYEKTKGREWLDARTGSNSRRDQVTAALTKASVYEAAQEYNGISGDTLNQSGKRDNYTLDLFGVPADSGTDNAPAGSAPGRSGPGLSRDDAPGTFATRTELVQENTRKLGTDRVTTPEEAAQALAYLGKGAVERFDALVTDAEGRSFSSGTFRQGTGNRGAYNPSTGTIALLKNADLSTFLHELGHHFLELMADMAVQQDAPAQVRQDFQQLLAWFDIQSPEEWHNLSFEEKRSYHEQFARGFEAYLFEGKAPSVELQTLFQRFRSWLVNVYKSLTQLNVELTDEVRGVMNRMLASESAIRELEQVQGYEPLFASAEAAGVTPEQFAAYQGEASQATTEAIDELQNRSLRDMKWLANAKGRAIKALQREAKGLRNDLRAEAAREVWSRPVYQAWQFLTAKENVEPVKPVAQPKGTSRGVDETRDTLLTAVAKLGGIDRESAREHLGLHPDDFNHSAGVFGKPPFRKTGGMSADHMVEALRELGYLAPEPETYDTRYDAMRDLEEKLHDEIGGTPHYSLSADYDYLMRNNAPGVEDLQRRNGGRLDADLVAPSARDRLKTLKMVKKDGLPPDLVAEMFGFTSGDELVRALAEANDPKDEIEGLTDQRMLERHGELSDPAAIERAAEAAIHNEVRARFMATGLKILTKSPLPARQIAETAKRTAEGAIAGKRIRDLRPGQYTAAEARANKNAIKAAPSDPSAAAVEQRAALLNNRLAKAALDAIDEVRRGVQYLKEFDKADIRKTLDADYADQIDALLERFDLRQASNKAVDKRAALAAWIESQREQGLEPDIPEALQNEAYREHYRNLTVEQFRGLLDTVKQIEHLGRLKHKLLTAADQRAYEAVRDEIATSIEANAQGRKADTRTPTTNPGRALAGLKRFFASHRKAAMLARTLDGEQDGGPMWEYFVRNANERGDMETTLRAEATKALTEILAPVFKLGKMGGAGIYFPSIQLSLNREARLAIALNIGNEGNLQRLLGGEGWTLAQLAPILDTITPAEWRAVQAIWNHFESYRPQIGAKERRVYGKEPAWVTPGSELLTQIAIKHQLPLTGGYYPIKYDPAASQRAEEHADAEGAKRQLQGAYTSATTRRSFTKARAEEVKGRLLLYSLAGLYSGVNDVIHDLAWHEWLIDVNRLMRSTTIDNAIRNHYGPEVKAQFKSWIKDVAEGESGAFGTAWLARLRQGVSAAGLGFNVVSALMQPLGYTQSIVRIGPKWAGKGLTRYLAHPIAATREANEKSDFMMNRARTRFRELNELRNKVEGKNEVLDAVRGNAYLLMVKVQQTVDVATWWGAYEKATADGNAEDRAVALADQAVIDSQGGGMLKDLSAVERGSTSRGMNNDIKIFTVFYSFMNTAFNMAANTAASPAGRAKKAVDLLLIGVVPAVLAFAFKQAVTPGGDDDEWDWEKLSKRLLAAEIDYLMGMMVGVREFSEAAKLAVGANDLGRTYGGPGGLRAIVDFNRAIEQAKQGEFDDAFRKAIINASGSAFGLPSAQVNRTITGAQALKEGETSNPAAMVFGFQKPN